MEISCANVPGGWQTIVYTADGGKYPFGPVYNRVTDLWAWQRINLYASRFTVADLPTSLGV